jgi:hypothetical protein
MIKLRTLLQEEAGPNAQQLAAAKVYFYGAHTQNPRSNFSPYGIKLFKSLDGNNLTYSVWGFGEEIITIPAGVFTSAVAAYKSEGKDINDAFISATNHISEIEDKIKKYQHDVDTLLTNTNSNKSMSERKQIVARAKKAIKYHNEIIKDIKSLK